VKRARIAHGRDGFTRTGTTKFIDVLDRVLDRGVMIDSWARVAGEALTMPVREEPAVENLCPTCGAVMKEMV